MDILLDEGVRIVTNAHIRQVLGDANRISLVADVDNKPRHFTSTRLLVAVGRPPNTIGIGLDHARVYLNEQGSVQVDSYLRTNVTHIWAAGDVIGGEIESQMAISIGAYDGGIAASNALGGALRQADHLVIPRTVFTDPEVAIVGITDEEATARGIECQCQAIPISAVPREGTIPYIPGVIKMVIEHTTHRALGVSMVGANAHEVIHEAAMGLRFRATVDDFIDMIHVYPSMAEALK
jgi:mercuric reductase